MSRVTVAVALRLEARAVRSALSGTSMTLLRTGMGPVRAAARLRALSSEPDALAVLGLAGGVAPDLRVGDVVVATEVRGDGVTVRCPAAPLVAGELRRTGHRVHLGPVQTQDHLAGRRELSALADAGVLAVDMESAEVARAAGGRPLLVVRVVSDTSRRPWWHPAIVLNGLRALRVLRAVAPVVRSWAAALGEREVHLASPRSFCAGVERAIDIVERALERYGAPVYVRRQIVHNAHIVSDLQRRGAVFVEELDAVPHGARVVLAAHGVAPEVREQAEQRSLSVIDATCPLVAKVHAEVRRYAGRGHTVFLIGHRQHEEVVGTVGEAPGQVLVVDGEDEARTVAPDDPDKVAYVMQTTLAVDEAERIAGTLRQRFPTLLAPRSDDICYATSNRQAAVRDIAADSDLVLVVGSTNSSNSLRLVEVAERSDRQGQLVDDAGDVRLSWLSDARRVGVTAGASAPPRLVDELVDALRGLGPVTVHEHHTVAEDVTFTLPREVS